jgi:hypothetical protein
LPRLAPNGKGVNEHRMTLGTYERKMIQSLNRQQSWLDYTKALALPISIFGIGASIAFAGFFLAPNFIDEIKEKIDIVKDTVSTNVKRGSGQQDDGSYATILSTSGDTIGKVIVAPGSGIPILGALVGASLQLLRSQSSTGGWQAIYGNFNKDAIRVEDLSEGWLYLNDLPGGSGQTWDV